MRIFRKWWLLRMLRRETKKHGMTLSVLELQFNKKHSVAREAMTIQLAHESVKRLSWLLVWRKKDNENKLKERLIEYNSIFDECGREELVYVEKENTLRNPDTPYEILNPPDRPFFRTTDLGDKYISEFWYKVLFDNAYAKAIITALVIAIAGFYVKQILKDNRPPVTNIYPTINVLPK